MGPIFNEKVAKKWNLWVHEQYIMHCLRQKSQHLRLLFIEQYMNSNRILPNRVKKKKKKKKKRKTQTWEENVDPNIHLTAKKIGEINIRHEHYYFIRLCVWLSI